MDPCENDILLVDGFEIHWFADGDEIWITVSKDGIDAKFGMGGPREAMPPREQLKHMAMNVWRACNNMRRRAAERSREGEAEEA